MSLTSLWLITADPHRGGSISLEPFMFQSEGHNPLKNCELVYSSYYFKWPKVADAVIEAHVPLVAFQGRGFIDVVQLDLCHLLLLETLLFQWP